MNIFLPYENDIIKSVESLDDLRLKKQIIEGHIMCEAILLNKTRGYINHWVTQFYKDNINFIGYYTWVCCEEYSYRANKLHVYHNYFLQYSNYKCIDYTPFYSQYSKNDPRCIRTSQNVSLLFQNKLNEKWSKDKKPPKWSKREPPDFFSNSSQ